MTTGGLTLGPTSGSVGEDSSPETRRPLSSCPPSDLAPGRPGNKQNLNKVIYVSSVPPSSAGSSTLSILLQSTTHRVKSSLGREASYNEVSYIIAQYPPVSSQQQHSHGLVVIGREVCALRPRLGRSAEIMVTTILEDGTEKRCS